ncbi:MAG: LysR family transcriptional regulator [Pseudonocardia sp.]|nr:LysR family transcriptional regulator [Pseudonocardia sp.]
MTDRAPGSDDWTELRSFWEVAVTSNVTRAAERLGISQPTLSRRISRLERRLGVALVVRTTRGSTLTTAGEQLRTELEPMARAAAAAVAAVSARPELIGPAVAACYGLDHSGFMHLLSERWPAAEWTSTGGGFADLLRSVASGPATVFAGVRLPMVTVPGLVGVDVMLVGRVRMWVALSTRHPLAAAEEVSMAQLADEPWIGPAEEDVLQALRAVCRLRGFDPRVVHRTRDDGTTRGLLAADMGIALASPASRHRDRGEVRITGVPCRDAPMMDVVVAVPGHGRAAIPVEVLHAEVRRWYLGRIAAQPRYQAWIDGHDDPFPAQPRPVRLDVPADPYP